MKGRGAFTLVELLVVIAIIALLANLLFAVSGSAIKSAHLTVDISNMRQIYYAVNMYEQDYDDDAPHSLLFTEVYAKSTKVYASPEDPYANGIPGVPDFPADLNCGYLTPQDVACRNRLRSPFRISYSYLYPIALQDYLDDAWFESKIKDPPYGLIATILYNDQVPPDRVGAGQDFSQDGRFLEQKTENRIETDGSYLETHIPGGWGPSCNIGNCFEPTS